MQFVLPKICFCVYNQSIFGFYFFHLFLISVFFQICYVFVIVVITRAGPYLITTWLKLEPGQMEYDLITNSSL